MVRIIVGLVILRFVLLLLLAVVWLLGIPAFAQPATYTMDIHNAPGWEPSTSYTYTAGPPTGHFVRVNSGAGWTPSGGTSGTWNNGQPLAAYQLIAPTTGSCTSAASGPGPSAGGVGGQPNTGSSISDGGCTWKYLSKTDYISFTGWAFDSGNVWTSGTDYHNLQKVYTGPKSSVYEIGVDGQGTPALEVAGCHSTVSPSTVGTTHGATADGCYWTYVGDIGYTSNTHPMPMSDFLHDTFMGSISGNTLTVTTPPTTLPLTFGSGNIINTLGMTQTIGTSISLTAGSGTTWTVSGPALTIPNQQMFNATTAQQNIMYHNVYVARLWNDREYLGGTNGENNPIRLCCHNWTYNDSGNFANAGTNGVLDGASGYGLPIIIEAAPGESFMDTLAANPSVALAGYNANNGVAIRGTGGGVVGFVTNDNMLTVHGIQFKSDGGDHAVTMNPGRACNMCMFDHDIMEDNPASVTVLECGAQCYFHNDLFVAHGQSGLMFDYGGRIYNSTLVCPPGGSCKAGIYDTWTSTFTMYGKAIFGNAVFGFTHFVATAASSQVPGCGAFCSIFHGTGNATDVASTDGNTFPAVSFPVPGAGVGTWYPQNFNTGRPECSASTDTSTFTPGTCTATFSMSPSAAFTTWPGNYRIGPSSTLYGVGTGPFGNFNSCGEFGTGFVTGGTAYPPCFVQGDTPDIIGTARPISGRYDIGALQYLVTSGPFTFTGNSLSTTSFNQGDTSGAPIGAVIVGYTGVATGTTTVALASSGNAFGFRLDSNPYPGTNLLCPSGGCPSVASVTDVSIVSTNAAAVGSPFTGPALSLVGLTSGGPFTFTGNSLSNTTYPEGAVASTVVGQVVVGSTGTATGTTTVSLSPTGNAFGFRLDAIPYPGTHLICPAGGCPNTAGPITDVGLTATNSAATGSPKTTALSLTGTTSTGPLLRVGIGVRRR